MNSEIYVLSDIIDRKTGRPYTTGFHRTLLGLYVAPYFLGRYKPASFLLVTSKGIPTGQQIFTSAVDSVTFYEANQTPYDPTGDYYYLDHLVIVTQNTVFYLTPVPEMNDIFEYDDGLDTWQTRLN